MKLMYNHQRNQYNFLCETVQMVYSFVGTFELTLWTPDSVIHGRKHYSIILNNILNRRHGTKKATKMQLV